MQVWRWAASGGAFATSGQPDNKVIPVNEGGPWPSSIAIAGNSAGPIDQDEDSADLVMTVRAAKN
jgi:hypothetical protein